MRNSTQSVRLLARRRSIWRSNSSSVVQEPGIGQSAHHGDVPLARHILHGLGGALTQGFHNAVAHLGRQAEGRRHAVEQGSEVIRQAAPHQQLVVVAGEVEGDAILGVFQESSL